MARIQIEDYDVSQHSNPMQWFDDTQRKRHQKAPSLIPYKVCLVTVKGFTFIFHSVEQESYSTDVNYGNLTGTGYKAGSVTPIQ